MATITVKTEMRFARLPTNNRDDGNSRAGLAGWGGRDQRRHVEEVVESGALPVAKVGVSLGGVKVGLALRFGKVLERAERAAYGVGTVRGQAAELCHGSANLLPLLWLKMAHPLGARDGALALLRGHGVEPAELVAHPLLLFGA